MHTENLTNYEKSHAITVIIPSAEQLLAVKVFAASSSMGEHDLEHAAAPCKDPSIENKYQAEQILKKFFSRSSIKEQSSAKDN